MWNGYTGDALGQESWSDEELEKRLQQLKSLKYTAVAIPKAVKPFAAIRVDGDTAGRKAFGGAKTFENTDVAAITARFREKAAKRKWGTFAHAGALCGAGSTGLCGISL